VVTYAGAGGVGAEGVSGPLEGRLLSCVQKYNCGGESREMVRWWQLTDMFSRYIYKSLD